MYEWNSSKKYNKAKNNILRFDQKRIRVHYHRFAGETDIGDIKNSLE